MATQLREAPSAAEQYFLHTLLHVSPDISTTGGVRMDIFFCLGLVWLAVYFCIFKGVKSARG